MCPGCTQNYYYVKKYEIIYRFALLLFEEFRSSYVWDTPTLHLQCVAWRLTLISWWRHQMEIFSALLAICAGNSPVPGEFPAQRPATRSFDVFFDLRLNKRLSKQSWGWWFETLSHPLWRHCNVIIADAKAACGSTISGRGSYHT